MELVIEEERLESFLPVLGAEVTEHGYIRHIETDTIATTVEGEKLTIDEVGFLGVAEDRPENIVLVKDNIGNIVDHLSETDTQPDPTE
jgi:hypothetical protein